MPPTEKHVDFKKRSLMETAVSTIPVAGSAPRSRVMDLSEFMVQATPWTLQVPVLDQLLVDICNSLEEAFRRDSFEVGKRSSPSLLRGPTAFGRRASLRVCHPLFGWSEVQVRCTVHWPAGAELTLVAFPEVPKPVRPRTLRNDCITKRHLVQLTQQWGDVTPAGGMEILHQWLCTLSGSDIGAVSLFEQAAPFRTDVELAMAP